MNFSIVILLSLNRQLFEKARVCSYRDCFVKSVPSKQIEIRLTFDGLNGSQLDMNPQRFLQRLNTTTYFTVLFNPRINPSPRLFLSSLSIVIRARE